MESEASAMRTSNQDHTSRATHGGSLQDTMGTSKNDVRHEITPLLSNESRTVRPDESSNGGSGDWEGANDFVGQPWNKRPSLYWLLPAFSLFTLAFGGTLVPKINLIVALVCREYLFDKSAADPSYIFTPVLLGTDNPQCRQIPEVQALVSRFTLFLTVIPGCLSAIMAPKIGSWSDRYGRKKFMALSSCGLFLSEIVTILVANYPDVLHYKWLIAGSVIDGLSGSFTVGMALTHAYAADCTAPPKRGVAFGYFHACLFTGIAFGPLLAGLLIKLTGEIITIFYVALGVHAFFILYILLIVPESLTKKRQQLAQLKHASAVQSYSASAGVSIRLAESNMFVLQKLNILEPLKILWPTGPGSSSTLRRNLILLAAVDTITFGVGMGAMTVVVLYMGYQFGWGSVESSNFVSLVNIVRVSCLLFLLPLLNYLVRTRRSNRERRESGFAIPERNSGSDMLDLATIRVAIFFEIVGFCGYALARTGTGFAISGALAALGGVGSPTLQSALTKHVPQDQIGQLLGATALLHALARVIMPSFFNLLYAATVDRFPQTVFVVLTGFFGVAFVGSWLIKPHVYLDDDQKTTANVSQARDDNDEGGALLDEEVGNY